MIHTFIGPVHSDVLATVREPFRAYLRSSIDLVSNLARSLGRPVDPARISESDMSDLLDIACERYFSSNTLFGTATSCLELVEEMESAGVDELACMVDFGIETDTALRGLDHLEALRRRYASESVPSTQEDLVEMGAFQGPVLFQSTPSRARILLADP